MRLVVFHAMKFCLELGWIRIKSLRKRFWNSRELRQNFHALAREGWHAHRIEKLRREPRIRVAGHGDVIDVFQFEPGFFQAIANRLRRKACGILDAVEALFFHRGHEPAVADNRRGCVTVIRIYPKNIHTEDSVYLRSVHHAARWCLHHSFRTYNAHGRDHEVLPSRNAAQTARTPSGRSCDTSDGAMSAKLDSIRGRRGPRSHSSQGSVKVFFR